MTTILLTGFEPFAGATSNPSWDAAQRVAESWTGPETLIIDRLPVAFRGAGDSMRILIDGLSPDVVIAVGVADGRSAITPERVALNLEDARIPDNAGEQPVDAAVVDEAPAAYFSGLPVKDMVEKMREAGIPADVSQSAGSYVCNSLMYQLMREIDGTDIVGGFIHVPASRELAEGTTQPYLETAQIAQGLEIAIRASLDTLP
jgi:pyroglutamyl-peptidase